MFAASGAEGAAFLDIPAGAGPAALGSAYSALAADAYAPVWNPAGAAILPNTQVAAQHLAYIENLHYEFVSAVHPISLTQGIGISAQYLGTGDIAGTDPAGNSTGHYSDHYGAYAAAFGQRVNDKLSLGLAGKWIQAQLADVSASAFAADLGSLYQSGNLSLAFTLMNVGSRLKFSSQSDSLPLAGHLAGAYQFKRWILAVEGVQSQTGLTSGRFGLEWSPIEIVALRAGYRTETIKELNALAGLTVGMGVTAWGQELAYAWLPYGDLGSTQYLSMLLRFGQGPERRRHLIQYQSIKRHRDANRTTSDPDYIQLMEMLGENKDPTVQIPTDGQAR